MLACNPFSSVSRLLFHSIMASWIDATHPKKTMSIRPCPTLIIIEEIV